jgi:oligopeptidase A
MKITDTMKNPLLIKTELPKFNAIKPKHIKPAIAKLIKQNLVVLDKVLKTRNNFTWGNLFTPLEAANDRLDSAWSAVKHLNAVMHSKELRKAYIACLPMITRYTTKFRLNTKLYNAILSLQKNAGFTKLDKAQQQIIANELRDFRLAGINLPAAEKATFKRLLEKMTGFSAQFANNVLDATQNWQIVLNTEAVAGIPAHALALAQQAAQRKKVTGYLFNLEGPSFLSVITYAESRKLREQIYTAYITRASDQGPNAGKWDNSKIMGTILNARLQLAKLVHYKNYAEYSLATKMAKTPKQVLNFLDTLVKKTTPAAKKEFRELCTFAKKIDGITNLKPWDIAYYSEKLRQKTYTLSQEELRPYFPEHQVLQGLFNIAHKLFGITVKASAAPNTWHPDVKFFTIYDRTNNLRGAIYMDLYARENKQSGAWMDICKARRKLQNGKIQIPVAHLVGNFSGPVGKTPALFTHDEVYILFHEFGHCLQQVLTTVDYAAVSGVNGVLWDAVELASQFMENWCWEPAALQLIAKHYQTRKTLPPFLIKKLYASRNFQAAMQMLRQLEFALFDFRLHLEFNPKLKQQIQKLYDTIRTKISVVPNIKYNRIQHSFKHIFAGGYEAGYYSYKWAEVLAHDAFAKFQEQGIFDRKTGQLFLSCILEPGGSEDPMVLFKKFRGREPKITALLKHYGIK